MSINISSGGYYTHRLLDSTFEFIYTSENKVDIRIINIVLKIKIKRMKISKFKPGVQYSDTATGMIVKFP